VNCYSTVQPKTRLKGSFRGEVTVWCIAVALWLLIQLIGTAVGLSVGMLAGAGFAAGAGLLATVVFLPALGYSMWRYTTFHRACPYCESATLVPDYTPRAKSIKPIQEQAAQASMAAYRGSSDHTRDQLDPGGRYA